MATESRIIILGTGMGAAVSALASHPAVTGADVIIASPGIIKELPGLAARAIPVKAPVSAVLDEAATLLDEGKNITVLAGGDPLFYSIGVSFVEQFGPERVRVLPGVSSVQAAAAKFALPLGDMVTVSAHGRSGFLPLAHAVLHGGPVCLLTDAVNTPGSAARFLLERGRTDYMALVAANIGNERETLWRGTLDDAAGRAFPAPNLVFFLPDTSLPGPLPLCPGQPESAFAREGELITKWPVRAAVLAALRIEPGHVVWDLGSGSGSVAVEAASLARRGHIVAVEQEARRVRHIEENRKRFGAANLDIVHTSTPGCLEEGYTVMDGPDLRGRALPRPDRVFVGGGLGGTPEDAAKTIRLAWRRLAPGGRLVAACVLLDDIALARRELLALDGNAETALIQASAAAPLGNGAHLRAMNPVTCIAAYKIA